MTEKATLDSVGIHQVRPECVDWKSKSAHPGIRQIAAHLSRLLAESRELISGPASELVLDVEETTASQYSNETNRVLRVTADLEGESVAFDVVVHLAASTVFTSPYV